MRCCVPALLAMMALRSGAQTPFQGYTATLATYGSCNPFELKCRPDAIDKISVPATGEFARETQGTGDSSASHVIEIHTKAAEFDVFPGVGMYYEISLPLKTTVVNDHRCAHQAGDAMFIEEDDIRGHAAFQYQLPVVEGATRMVWLFPDADCAQLESTTDFYGTSPTSQSLIEFKTPFTDDSVLKPRGVAASPIEVLHANFTALATNLPHPVDAAAAEARWKAAMAD